MYKCRILYTLELCLYAQNHLTTEKYLRNTVDNFVFDGWKIREKGTENKM